MNLRKKILIVEDDTALGDALCLLLEEAGYETRLLEQGDLLLQNEYELPHLFILDRQLAGIDGLDLCRYLKAEPKSKAIPVILLSATPQVQKLAATAGADAFEEKPFRRQVLLPLISQLLKV